MLGPPQTEDAMTANRTSTQRRSPAKAAALAAGPLLSALLLAGCADQAARARIEALRRPPVTQVLIDTTQQPVAPPPAIEAPPDRSVLEPPGTPPPLHTEGNRILRADGQPVRLRGLNIASLEWTDEGENVQRSLEVAITDWGCNIVRVPLTQDRWFGRAPTQTDGGARYRSIVDALVAGAAQRGAYILLDLHWSNSGVWGENIGQHSMPDTGSLFFWGAVARRYANHPAVLMGLYNEPHDISWDVWLRGGAVDEKARSRTRHDPTKPLERTRTTVRYRAIGHQELYDVVRAAGATENVVVAGGLDWAYDLAGLAKGYAISGTNIVYDAHVYPGKDWKPELSWENAFITPSRQLPVLVGEWGGSMERDEGRDFVTKLVECLHANEQLSWTAWCFHPTAGPTLIRNWNYEPTGVGQIVIDELRPGREPAAARKS
jgi:hypothetical protein